MCVQFVRFTGIDVGMVTAAVLVSLVVLLLEVVGVHLVGHVSAQDDGLVVFDEKTCGTV